MAKVAASLFAVCWTWNSLSCDHVPLAGVESCAVHLARTYFSAVARKWKVALIRVFEFSLREETCGSDGWRARGQTDSVEVAYPSGRGANGNGLGQCGDDLHLPATRRAFRHPSIHPTKGRATQARHRRGKPVQAGGPRRGDRPVGVTRVARSDRSLRRPLPVALERCDLDLRHLAPTHHDNEQGLDEAEE